jgi:hypothetical protein
MTQLSQLLAIEKGVKTSSERDITDAYHMLQREDPITGLIRTYQPLDDEGETLPDEVKLVQTRVSDQLARANTALAKLMNITLEKDATNCVARADVVIDGAVVLPDVPVTYLLFLEKQLIGLQTLVSQLPILDPAFNWTLDEATGNYKSDSSRTNRSKKVMRNHVKAEATDKHPAQVETYTEDVKVGEWTVTRFSGAIPADDRRRLLERVRIVLAAVKQARELGNTATVVQTPDAGRAILDYIFA